jgi:release factor glutamine methyltransferase
VKQACQHIRETLSDLFSEKEIAQLTGRIICHVCQLQSYQFLSCKDKQLSENERQSVEQIVERLRKHEPLQYILGETEFYGLPLKVTGQALIPRPETEELVDWILEDEKQRRTAHRIRILDVGTGCGCIAVALAKHLPEATVFGMDVSKEALDVAAVNGRRLQLAVQWIQGDILSMPEDEIPDSLDVIVSNPPYVLPSEKSDMQPNVLLYEPHEALFVPTDRPLIFYERIADLGLSKPAREGTLYFEINAAFGKEIQEMLHAKGYRQVQLKQDISGKDRLIKAKR